jgi:hypothetical protein
VRIAFPSLEWDSEGSSLAEQDGIWSPQGENYSVTVLPTLS